MSPAVSTITPMSRTTNVAPSVRKVPADSGTDRFPASAPARASPASIGTKRPKSMSIVPRAAENEVAP
jgi:hypothetical protein